MTTPPEEGAASFHSLRQVFQCLDRSAFQELAVHILKGNQVIVRGSSVTMVTSLINVLKVSISFLITHVPVHVPALCHSFSFSIKLLPFCLGLFLTLPLSFCFSIHILPFIFLFFILLPSLFPLTSPTPSPPPSFSYSSPLLPLLPLLLLPLLLFPSSKDLVPEKCCQIVAFSPTYREPFVCNFLGLSSSTEIPKHVMSSDQHVVVEILPPRCGQGRPRMRDSLEAEARQRESGSPLGGHRLAVQPNSRNGDAKCEGLVVEFSAI